ncbi:WecB/TagA/CpsF family glycosyltransferase [Methylomicrobium lacus]|uniref:WecB/TagA/CpsF family glycosyltransferase n=1 Tax=Methylomicrobium lacus TaxID=136992 RepID=UPI0035A8D10F
MPGIDLRSSLKVSLPPSKTPRAKALHIYPIDAAASQFGGTALPLNMLTQATAANSEGTPAVPAKSLQYNSLTHSGAVIPNNKSLPGNWQIQNTFEKVHTPVPNAFAGQYPAELDILGLKFPLLDYASTLNLFKQWIAAREPHQVCMANVHTVITSLSDNQLKSINNHSLITMDGLPLVWYARAVHQAKIKERVCGPELMLRCLDQGREHGWKHFFLGGKENVLTDLVSAMQSRFPGVEIVGWHSPPFRPLSAEEDAQLVALINQHQPDFLWVALGAPKQEKWIAEHLTALDVPVQAGVGAAFDFHSGHVRRAPVWMQNAGLEWLYRILQDQRLIKRYLMTNPIFLALFVRDCMVKNLRKTVCRCSKRFNLMAILIRKTNNIIPAK